MTWRFVGSRVAPLVLVAALSACRSKGGNAPTETRPAMKVPAFHADVLPVLLQDCANAEGCHGNKPTESVDLDLRAAVAFSQLVGAPAEARKGAVRVKPGEPAASFLIDKLAGTLRSGEGKSMPIDVETGVPLSPSPLPPDYLEKVLKPWIEAGAPNN